jgi:hypothetical protein
MPAAVDSNSPAYWQNGELHLLNSTGDGPISSEGPNQRHLGGPEPVYLSRINPWPMWIEAVFADDSGLILAWYHQEHWGVCPGTSLAVPQIGAAISYDGGASFQDMGIVLSSGDPIDCNSQNGNFAGGEGDFEYFYFLFTHYSGALESQGVAIARMPFASRFAPNGAVWKFYRGGWTEPGVKGRVTPVLPAVTSWQNAATDSYWGPSLHRNTYLNSYVMLLNHSCCSPGFPQEGIYASFNPDLSDPGSWTAPARILDDTGWYPQVLGSGPDGTDTVAGRIARFYTYGHSRWQVIFTKPGVPGEEPPPEKTSPLSTAANTARHIRRQPTPSLPR